MMRLDSGGWVRLKNKGGMSECGPPHQQPAATTIPSLNGGTLRDAL